MIELEDVEKKFKMTENYEVNLCELCLKQSDEFIQIFENENSESKVAMILIKLFWFEVCKIACLFLFKVLIYFLT